MFTASNYSSFWAQKRWRLLLAVAGFSIAILQHLIFWNKENGLGMLLFILSYLAVFSVMIFSSGMAKQLRFLLLIIPIMILSVDVFLFNNDFVTFFVPLVVYFLIALMSLLVTLNREDGQKLEFLGIKLVRRWFIPILGWRCLSEDLKDGDPSSDRSVLYRKIIFGLVITLPLLIIFGVIFSRGDREFGEWLISIFKYIAEWEFFKKNIFNFVKVILFGLVFSGFLYEIFNREHKQGYRNILIEKFDTTVVVTLLGSLNFFFLIFVIFQFKYLFASYSFVVDNSLVFSAYAKAGYGQLAVATCLAFLIMAVIYRSASAAALWPKIITYFTGFFILQNVIIAVSAWRRLELYEQAYGLTARRFYGEAFIYLVIAILILALVSLVRKWEFRRFLHVILTAFLLAFVGAASINADYIIAKNNLKQFSPNDQRRDLTYLLSLSVDVVPALAVNDFAKLDDGRMYEFSNYLNSFNKKVERHDTFVEFNWGVFKTKDALTEVLLLANKRAEESLKKSEQLIQKSSGFYKKYSEIKSQFSPGCSLSGLPTTRYDCAAVLYIKGKSLEAVYDRQTRTAELYQWVGKEYNYKLVRIALELPESIKNNKYDEILVMNGGFFIGIDNYDFIIRKYKVAELKGKYLLVESDV